MGVLNVTTSRKPLPRRIRAHQVAEDAIIAYRRPRNWTFHRTNEPYGFGRSHDVLCERPRLRCRVFGPIVLHLERQSSSLRHFVKPMTSWFRHHHAARMSCFEIRSYTMLRCIMTRSSVWRWPTNYPFHSLTPELGRRPARCCSPVLLLQRDDSSG